MDLLVAHHRDRITARSPARWRRRPEREAVVGAIRGTPGVRAVDDKIRIEPFSI
jgi:hypothetical protein